MKRKTCLTLLLAVGSALQGCALLQLQADTQALGRVHWVHGQVRGGAGPAGVVVAAYTRLDGQARVAQALWLHEDGPFDVPLPAGSAHTLAAFSDANGNARLDAGEACVEIELGDGPQPAAPELDLRAAAPADACSPMLGQVLPAEPGLRRSRQAGAVGALDEPRHSAEQGRLGYWAPLRYLRETGANIDFLQPYDPARMPVLFVHGAGGSPQDWRFLLSGLDTRRYQPWLFRYPSGASLDLVSQLLRRKLLALQARHGYTTLCITAHSMGGLLVRHLLVHHGHELPFVRSFVSLSTPWAGDEWAATGVQLAPAVVPSWRDLQPAGPFLTTLFDRRLPPPVAHHLLFSYRGRAGLRRQNNDGAVTLSSQLHPGAQAEAATVWGFDEDHDSILTSPQVAARYHALLAAMPTGGPAR